MATHSLFERLKVAWTGKRPRVHVSKIKAGDYVRLYLKSPKQVGIICDDYRMMTYQRLTDRDLKTLQIDGLVTKIGYDSPSDSLNFELTVPIYQSSKQVSLKGYFLLQDEIINVEILAERREEEE